ncbi:MAG TPA: hypothetical protein VI636_10890 [Candidatus Angelobacter sp.]
MVYAERLGVAVRSIMPPFTYREQAAAIGVPFDNQHLFGLNWPGVALLLVIATTSN